MKTDRRSVIPFTLEDVQNMALRNTNLNCQTKIQRDYRDKMKPRYQQAIEILKKDPNNRQHACEIITHGYISSVSTAEALSK